MEFKILARIAELEQEISTLTNGKYILINRLVISELQKLLV